MKEKIIIALDAMGGDNAPGEIVKGGVNAAAAIKNIEIVLVGREDAVNAELSKLTYDKERVRVVHAETVIGTDEVPTVAVRRKRDSSMIVGLNMVKKGEADAFISAGSTGALMVGATVIVGRIKGIERPALGTCLPTVNGFTFLVDSGANADCKPHYLQQFAKMGSVYVENVLGIKNPRVGLANIGVEAEKGNMLTKEAYELLSETEGINFVGNIEAREVPFGAADVLVCDGFVGNTILKFAEGLASALMGMIKKEITAGPYKLAAAMLKKPFKNVKKAFDSDEVGGAPLLGLKSLVVKAHGSSNAYAIECAVRRCLTFVEQNIAEKIEQNL